MKISQEEMMAEKIDPVTKSRASELSIAAFIARQHGAGDQSSNIAMRRMLGVQGSMCALARATQPVSARNLVTSPSLASPEFRRRMDTP